MVDAAVPGGREHKMIRRESDESGAAKIEKMEVAKLIKMILIPVVLGFIVGAFFLARRRR
jgi:hypothetical protein